MNGHVQQELRRRRLDAKVRLLTLAREVREDPLDPLVNAIFVEAVKVGFSDGVTLGQMAQVTRWSQNSLRGCLND